MTKSNNMTTTVKIIRTGSWYKLSIVSVTEGHSQILKDGKWVNASSTIETFEDEILTLGKYFDTAVDAEKYAETKGFKQLLKLVQKGGL
jgi:hypothetical protein